MADDFKETFWSRFFGGVLGAVWLSTMAWKADSDLFFGPGVLGFILGCIFGVSGTLGLLVLYAIIKLVIFLVKV